MSDQPNRREFIQTGLAAGTAAAVIDAQESSAASSFDLSPSRRAETLVFIWLAGGLSQAETWDAKSHTPFEPGMRASDLRGTSEPIETAVDGVYFAAGLERMASLMHMGTVVRSVTHTHPLAIEHKHAQSLWLTGQPAFDDATLIGQTIVNAVGPGAANGYGHAYTGRGPITDNVTMNALQRALAGPKENLRPDLLPYRDRLIGKHKPDFSSDLNLTLDFVEAITHADRFVEEGARFVFIEFGFDPYQGLDVHHDGAQRLDIIKSTIDFSLSHFIEKLQSDGRLDNTAVIVASEFGRTIRCDPKVGQDYTIDDERDYGYHAHHPGCQSVLLFGGPFKRGYAYGRSTDTHPAQPSENPVTVADMRTTLFAAMGVPCDEGRVVADLFA